MKKLNYKRIAKRQAIDDLMMLHCCNEREAIARLNVLLKEKPDYLKDLENEFK
jgi:hypothetical protein